MSRLLSCLVLAAGSLPAQFVPAAFQPPASYETAQFVLVPLGPGLEKLDFDAYMSSIDHLKATFTNGGKWPHPGITMAEALKDVEGEIANFKARKAFTYAVLTKDKKREVGCVYIAPSRQPGFEAQVRMWVTKADFDRGVDAEVEKLARAWVSAAWPFKKVAWPGRDK
ncbi:MAG: twin-arginine translocation pathway signal protein [Acidobacteria bacterium]|nr:twin-arginine translocation pathway signal protein [Acidobacteriota bacterium]